jgi:hypothetical protein
MADSEQEKSSRVAWREHPIPTDASLPSGSGKLANQEVKNKQNCRMAILFVIPSAPLYSGERADVQPVRSHTSSPGGSAG